MRAIPWWLQAQWKFVAAWTAWAIACGVGSMLLDAAANGWRFSPEGVGIALVMPVAGLVSAPILWRVFVQPRLRKAGPRTGNE